MTSAAFLTAVTAAFKLKITFGIGVTTSPTNYIEWDDITDYNSISGAGWVVKTLIHVQTQVNTTVYKSAGYDTNDFSNPEYPTNDPSSQKTLPSAVNGKAVEGVYKFTFKFQYSDSATAAFVVDGLTISSQPLCLADAPTVDLSLEYSCKNATFTGTDSTSYGNSKYTLNSVVRALTGYPPAISGQSSTTVNAPSLTLSNLWTDVTYEFKLASTVTYKKDDNYFVFYVTGNDELKVQCDDDLCKLYCLLKKIRDEYYKWARINNPSKEKEYYTKVTLGELEYFMAIQARICSPTSEQGHIDKFYEVTELDPDCDCGCGSGTDGASGGAPVIPSSTGLQGAAGTNGLSPELRVSSNLLQWKYTTEDASQWRTLVNISAFIGAAGTDGTATLGFIIADEEAFGTATYGTKSAGYTQLHTPIVIPINRMSADKDNVNVKASVLAWGADGTFRVVFKRVTAGGVNIVVAAANLVVGGNTQCVDLDITIKRVGSDKIQWTVKEKYGSTILTSYEKNRFNPQGNEQVGNGPLQGTFDFANETHHVYVEAATSTPPNEIRLGYIIVNSSKSI